MSNDILLLTTADHLNYVAICNFVHGRKVRETRNRQSRDIVSNARKFALLHEQDYCCAHCGDTFETNGFGKYRDVTADHVIKYQYGGEANHHNIVLVHQRCNLARDREYSIKVIEDHFGPIDQSMLVYVPVVRFKK